MSNDLRINEIKPALLSVQRQIQSLLNDEAKAKRFMAGALVVAASPALMKCTPDSIVQACVGIAMSDLNIDPTHQHAYIIPFWSKEGMQAQLQLGYKGYIQLLFRAGWLVKAFPVFLCDEFSIKFNGWDNEVNFIPSLDERQEGDNDWCFHNLRGVYVVARHADTKDEYSLFVNKSVIEKLRLNSQNQKINQYTKPEDKARLESGKPVGIWQNWPVEMAQAKAIKKLAKLLPIGDSRLQNMLAADDITDQGRTVDFKQSVDSSIIIEQPEQIEKTQLDAINAAQTLEELQAIKPKNKVEKLAFKARFDLFNAQVQTDDKTVENDDEWS